MKAHKATSDVIFEGVIYRPDRNGIVYLPGEMKTDDVSPVDTDSEDISKPESQVDSEDAEVVEATEDVDSEDAEDSVE